MFFLQIMVTVFADQKTKSGDFGNADSLTVDISMSVATLLQINGNNVDIVYPDRNRLNLQDTKASFIGTTQANSHIINNTVSSTPQGTSLAVL